MKLLLFLYKLKVFLLVCLIGVQWTWMPVAQAQAGSGSGSGSGSGGVELTCDELDAQAASEGRRQRCSMGNHQFQGQGEQIGGQIMQTVMVWAAAAVGAFIVSICTKAGNSCSIASMLAAVGSLALLAGEIAANAKHKRTVDNISYRSDLLRKHATECAAGKAPPAAETGGVNVCDQFDSLKAQKEAYVAIKEALEIKSALYITAAGAYGISSIMEFIETIRRAFQLRALKVAIRSAKEACQTAVNTDPPQARVCTTAPACIIALTTAESGTPNSVTALDERYFTRWQPQASQTEKNAINLMLTAINTTVTSGCTGLVSCSGCQSPVNTVTQQLSDLIREFNCVGTGCSPLASTASPTSEVDGATRAIGPTGGFNNMNFFNLIEKVYAADTRQGDAGAGTPFHIAMSVLSYTGFLVFFILFLTVWKDTLDQFWAVPLKRAIFLIIMGVLVGGLLLYLHLVQLPSIEKNIKAIDDILKNAQITVATVDHGVTDNLKFGDGLSLPPGVFDQELDITTNEGKAFPCAFGGDGKGGCMHIGESQIIRLSNQGLGSLAAGTKAISRLEQGMSGRNRMNRSTMNEARSLAGMHGAIKKKLKETQELVNKTFKENGKPVIDFDKEANKVLSGMYKKLEPAWNGPKGAEFRENFAKTTPESIMTPEEKKAMAAEAANLNKSGLTEGTGFNQFELTELEGEKGTELQAGVESAQVDISGKTVKGEGIFDNPDANIFELLSVRYLKSAYPVLFDEDKK